MSESTGLPTVGPKEFWRVGPAYTQGYVKVDLRRRLWFGMSVSIEYALTSEDFRMEEKIRNAARGVVTDVGWVRARNERMRVIKKVNPLYGDYPPKKLVVPRG